MRRENDKKSDSVASLLPSPRAAFKAWLTAVYLPVPSARHKFLTRLHSTTTTGVFGRQGIGDRASEASSLRWPCNNCSWQLLCVAEQHVCLSNSTAFGVESSCQRHVSQITVHISEVTDKSSRGLCSCILLWGHFYFQSTLQLSVRENPVRHSEHIEQPMFATE